MDAPAVATIPSYRSVVSVPTVMAKNSIVLARKTAFCCWKQQCVCLDLIFQLHHLQQPILSRPPRQLRRHFCGSTAKMAMFTLLAYLLSYWNLSSIIERVYLELIRAKGISGSLFPLICTFEKTAFCCWNQQSVCLDLIFQLHHLQQPILSRPLRHLRRHFCGSTVKMVMFTLLACLLGYWNLSSIL